MGRSGDAEGGTHESQLRLGSSRQLEVGYVGFRHFAVE